MTTTSPAGGRKGLAEACYERLEARRNEFIDRARISQRLTLPYWLADSDSQDESAAPGKRRIPYTSIGGMGTNNLASRLTMTLMPVGELFFRFAIDEIEASLAQTIQLNQEAQAGGLSEDQLEDAHDRMAAQRSSLDGVLATLERGVLLDLEAQDSRPEIDEISKHLLIVGNVLVQDTDEGLLCHSLLKYVLRRFPNGKPAEAVLMELVELEQLPKRTASFLQEQKALDQPESYVYKGQDDTQKLKVYTHIRWDRSRCQWNQEILGHAIPGTRGSSRAEEAPWMPLRLQRLSSTAYSPGYVEAVALADLQTAETLTQALTERALGQSKFLTGRRPGAHITERSLKQAQNGAVVTAHPDDIFPIELGLKGQNTSMAEDRLSKIEARLNTMFMVMQARDSERTTAEEIRQLALQVDQSMSGLYSLLAKDFLQTLVRRRLVRMLRAGRVPQMPEIVRPVVNVGLAAIGRATDLERLRQFLAVLFQSVGPEQVLESVNVGELIRRVGAASSVPTAGLIKSEARKMRERGEAQARAMQLQIAQAGAADPQRLANAAATVQGMAQPPPDDAMPQEQLP